MSVNVIVGNLPLDIKPQSIEELCKHQELVKSVSLPTNSSGRALGFAILEIDNYDFAVSLANSLSQQLLSGRQLTASVENKGKKGTSLFHRLFRNHAI